MKAIKNYTVRYKAVGSLLWSEVSVGFFILENYEFKFKIEGSFFFLDGCLTLNFNN